MKPKKILLILTQNFPYLAGEEFFEDEISYWIETDYFDKIVLMPHDFGGKSRKIPEGIEINLTIAKSKQLPLKIVSCLRALVSQYFFKEIKYLNFNKKITIKTMLIAYVSTAVVLCGFLKLRRWLRINGGHVVIYSYWNNLDSYAAALLKKEGLVQMLVSRAHGGDVYEERREHNYMPLKRQFLDLFDSIFVLSRESKEYFKRIYGLCETKLVILPLGVPVGPFYSEPSGPGALNIVSVSSCIKVKRIDKIIMAIAIASDRLPHVRVSWNHIGDGPLFEELKLMSSNYFHGKKNLKFIFLGRIKNSDVKDYYFKNKVDLFVNASESEGMPVSIMEAMSAGVPAIAPDVGGISDLVSSDCGILLSSNPSCEEIACAICSFADKAKDKKTRGFSKWKVQTFFNAEVNYRKIVKAISRLI